jgi:hypothetical protein
LPWLAPIQPKLCIDTIEKLEANSAGECAQPEFVVKQFESIAPKLLFAYLDKRIHSLVSKKYFIFLFGIFKISIICILAINYFCKWKKIRSFRLDLINFKKF